MDSACRTALHTPSLLAVSHAGLAHARYLRAHKEMPGAWPDTKRPTPEEQLLDALVTCAASGAYQAAFARFEAIARPAATLRATTAGPLAVGLGSATPLETGLAINHTYGMPFVPGSAVKGMCRRAAARLVKEEQMGAEQFDALFGTQEAVSAFIFWDAWFDPTSVDGKPFHRDVITVHHPRYYSTRGAKAWPTDFDDPTPVPFLVVRPGATFMFAVTCPTPAWTGYALNLLSWALENLGAGGKTNAGYGRFRDIDLPPPPEPEPVRETWQGVTVRRTLPMAFTVHGPRGDVVVSGRQAEEINRGLGPEVRERLKKRPEFRADVEVEVKPAQTVILSLVPTEAR